MGDDERKRKKTGSPPQPHPRSVILPWLCFYGCCSSFSFSTKQTHLSISPHKVYDNYRFFFFLSLSTQPFAAHVPPWSTLFFGRSAHKKSSSTSHALLPRTTTGSRFSGQRSLPLRNHPARESFPQPLHYPAT